MGTELPSEGGDALGGRGHHDWAQVYSTVHVSPVWLRGWGRGPVGVTTEAGVCKGGRTRWWLGEGQGATEEGEGQAPP